MVTNELINPRSIVVVGGSNDITKPGGKILKNLIGHNYQGKLYVVNPKETVVQGIQSFQYPAMLPQVDLAIIAIAARHTPAVVKILAEQKMTRAFIILSAGFSEESEAGRKLEQEIVDTINDTGGSLVGPNCIGLLTPKHASVFTEPVPVLDPKGIDFISGSGATAVFIMESAVPKGLTFNSVFSVGNSAQLGVEEILQHFDESFDPETSSRVKLLYIETINKPQKLLRHASSLIRKGCRIAAIKAGSSEAGSRAASSHTGALASPDAAVDALFRKAGIVRCYGREDLIAVASVFMHPALKGENIAIITHAGGPAVMLTDVLSNGGLKVPQIAGNHAVELQDKLYPGSSVANPIDFLATGTAEQLGTIIDYVEKGFNEIDGMVIIYGTPGLIEVFDAYDVIDKKMKTCKKPIYPVLPSILTAHAEVADFLSKGRVNFPDEAILGNALCRVYRTAAPAPENIGMPDMDQKKIRAVIQRSADGYLSPQDVADLLDAAGIPRAGEAVAGQLEEAMEKAKELGFPVVMKVVGPVHKSDVGGVVLNVKDTAQLEREFKRMMDIPGTTAILIQPMLSGTELFAGAKYEPGFGHMILCGLGGIFIEVLRDVSTYLAPVSTEEAHRMIRGLKSYGIIKGVRGREGVSEKLYVDVIVRLSALVNAAPEIMELDLNPLLGSKNVVTAVDARIRIEK
jgi:acetate---CoA ligase (ADP-forming)